MYDSTEDTLNHIRLVQQNISEMLSDLSWRALRHDQSKLVEPEKSAIDSVREELKQLEFGTPEYVALKDTFAKHHYAVNDHHIEHYENGVAGMTLAALCEMFCDWAAAVKTHKDGDNIYTSIDIICEQKNIDPQIRQIFINTAKAYGW